MSRPAEPVVGWRVWRFQGGGLHSWMVDYVWEPGENRATCLADRVPAATRTCSSPPGEDCMCGFWALRSPERCFVKARRETPFGRPGFRTVIGLMMGWGVVALHGEEGFRAEHASVLCLFDTSPWDADVDVLSFGRTSWEGWLFRLLRRNHDSPERARLLQRAADRYSVPLVSLPEAVRIGLLTELGVPAPVVDSMSRRLAARARRPGSRTA